MAIFNSSFDITRGYPKKWMVRPLFAPMASEAKIKWSRCTWASSRATDPPGFGVARCHQAQLQGGEDGLGMARGIWKQLWKMSKMLDVHGCKHGIFQIYSDYSDSGGMCSIVFFGNGWVFLHFPTRKPIALPPSMFWWWDSAPKN
jgi:hypothetical protein